jgi:acyl carrier protein
MEDNMTRQEFLHELENLLELEPGKLKGDELLSEIPQWDSMMRLNYIMFVEDKFKEVVDGTAVGKAKIVNDLIGFVEVHLRG